MDLFSMFGVQPEVQEEVKKGKKKEQKASNPKKNKEKEKVYAVPLTIVTGNREPITMEGSAPVTEKAIKAYLKSVYAEYEPSMVDVEIDEKNAKVYAAFKKSILLRKGEVSLSANSRLMLGGLGYDISSLVTGEESSKVALEKVQELLADSDPVLSTAGIYQAIGKEILIVSPVGADFKNEDISFPISAVLYGRERMEISREEFSAFLKETGNENGEFSKEAFTGFLEKRFPDMAGHIQLAFHKESKTIIISLKVTPTVAGGSKTKEELYPTEGTTMSFVFKRVELTPELFGGKTKVTKKELVKFAASIFPEYDSDKTQIRYEKDKKLIIPVLVGSTKGAM